MLVGPCSWLQPNQRAGIQMSFLIQPTALGTKMATREWKMMHGGADDRAAGYLMRQISAPAQADGRCQCISKSKIYVHHLRAHTPISYLGLSPL